MEIAIIVIIILGVCIAGFCRDSIQNKSEVGNLIEKLSECIDDCEDPYVTNQIKVARRSLQKLKNKI